MINRIKGDVMAVLKRLTKKKVESNAENKQGGEENLISKDMSDKYSKIHNLSPKQYEELLLLLEGYTLKKVAQKMNIKYSTANTHMTNLYKKLGVNTRAELIIQYRNLNYENKGE
jgi:DNA-binding CsgD family transcriptional regulator